MGVDLELDTEWATHLKKNKIIADMMHMFFSFAGWVGYQKLFVDSHHVLAAPIIYTKKMLLGSKVGWCFNPNVIWSSNEIKLFVILSGGLGQFDWAGLLRTILISQQHAEPRSLKNISACYHFQFSIHQFPWPGNMDHYIYQFCNSFN